MRKVLVIVAAIFCSLLLVYAQTTTIQTNLSGTTTNSGLQGDDDHNDNAPIQVGYAVVTPASFSTNGTKNMVVFETFGLHESVGATQAGVLPPDLTTDAQLFVDYNGELQKNLGVAIVNPNSSPETVTLTLRGSGGNPPLATATVQVPAHNQVAKFVSELFGGQPSVLKGVTGTLTVTSPDPVSVMGLRFRGANFSTLPITNFSNTGTVPPWMGAGGPGAVLLPQFAAGGGWATELVIVNNDSVNLIVQVDLFKQDGTALSTSLNNQSAKSSYPGIMIPPGGVYVLAPRDAAGHDDF